MFWFEFGAGTFEALGHLILSGPIPPYLWTLITEDPFANGQGKIAIKRTITITAGLNDRLKLSNAQIIIIGTKAHLKTLQFQKNLAAKLNGIDEKLFKAAINQLSNSKSVPLYLNLAAIVTIPTEVSRHNSPSNSYSLYRELKSIAIVDGIKALSIVLYSPRDHIPAHIAAIASAFPSFSRKSLKSTLEEISIEIDVADRKILPESYLPSLENLAEYIRICCRQVDTPCNEMNTKIFANEAVQMVNALGVPIKKTIIVGEKLKKQGFGGIYHVGKAAIHPPIFACFSYKPKGATKNIALCGKGIVYDTGGMSLKTPSAMPGMKIDMADAAAVLGAFCTLVKNGFDENLHVLLCIAENNISPVATKPDDIITMLSGKTVEVNNTDAEGRLVLADGVYYAKTKLKADIIIDMATLTLAQQYATGKVHAGVMSNCEKWEAKAVQAGRSCGDLVHPLVFAPDLHFSDFSSSVADMKNSNMGSFIGAPSSNAGLFIASHIDFAKGLSWIHFDILSPAFNGGRGTGFGVSLISHLLAEYTTNGTN